MVLTKTLYLIELLEQLLLLLWECAIWLVGCRLLCGFVSCFGLVGVVARLLKLGALVLKGFVGVLRGLVAGSPVGLDVARVVGGCWWELLLGSLGWVRWLWNFAFKVGAACVS